MTQKPRALWAVVISEAVIVSGLWISWYIDRQAKHARIDQMRSDLKRLEDQIEQLKQPRTPDAAKRIEPQE